MTVKTALLLGVLLLGDQRIHAVLIVDFPPGDGRVENAHALDLGLRPDLVLVMVVQ
jgi:hypothetical protein